MSNESIKFSFNKNKKVYVEVKSDGTIVHGKKDKSKQLATIFEQIAALGGASDKIDSAEEKKLVSMLKAIFSLGDSKNIDNDELEWISKLGTNDVKAYIEKKYNTIKDQIDKKYQVADEEPAEPEVDTEKQQARNNIIKGLAERVKAVDGTTVGGQQVYKETHGTRFFIFNEKNEFCEVVEQGGNYVIKDDAAAIKPDDIAEDPSVVKARKEEEERQAQEAAKQKQMDQVKRRNYQLSSKVDTLVEELGDVTAQGEHEVKKGDRLWNIAIEQLKKQEVTNPSTQQIINMIAQIKKLNPEMDINNLKIGQKIKLPAAKTEPPKGDDQDFAKKDEKEQIKLINEMNLDNQKAAGLVTVPKGTPEGVQEIFNEANAFLLEVADQSPKKITIQRDSNNYMCEIKVDGKWIRLRKYDDGSVVVLISNNTEKNDAGKDCAEVTYNIDKDGNIKGGYNNDYSNQKIDGFIESGINKDAILALVSKIFNHKEKAESFKDVGNYYVGLHIGANLYNQVKGCDSGNAADIIKNQITEDNVMGVINKFNSLSYKRDKQNITEFLMREWGLSRETGLIPANLLLQKAEKLKLTSTDEYKNLKSAIAQLQSSSVNLPEKHKNIDEAMNALIKKIQEDEQRV